MTTALAGGRQPDSDVGLAELFDEYVPIGEWDVSTTETSLGLYGCCRRCDQLTLKGQDPCPFPLLTVASQSGWALISSHPQSPVRGCLFSWMYRRCRDVQSRYH